MFSKKKKIWFVVVTILMLLVAGIFSFSMRNMIIIPESASVFGQRSQEVSIAKKLCWEEVYSKAQGNDRFFLQLNTGVSYPVNIIQCYKALHEAEPKNQIYLAYYAIYLAAADIKEAESDFRKLIQDWKELDPNNGMPYFLKAYVDIKKAVIEKKVGEKAPQKQAGKKAEAKQIDSVEYIIRDPALADLALMEYKAGLKKSYASCYTDLAIKKKLELANLKRDPLGEMQRLSVTASCIPIPLLGLEQDLTFRLAELAEDAARKGKKQEAEELLKSGKKYILLRMEKESPALINVLVYHSLCNCWSKTAGNVKNSEMAMFYDRIGKDFDTWRNSSRPDQALLKKHGGTFVQTLVPSIKVDIPVEDYKPERMINYLIIDQYGLMALFTQLGIIIILMALICGVFYLFKRKAQWIQLPVSSYILLGVLGVLLPLIIQLVWTHVDALSGRDVHFSLNVSNLSWLAKYQVLISPLFFAILACYFLVKKGNAKPLDCMWNLVFLLSGYLFLTIVIQRPIQDFEISHYTKQDKLIHSESGFTALEQQAIRELSGTLKENLKK